MSTFPKIDSSLADILITQMLPNRDEWIADGAYTIRHEPTQLRFWVTDCAFHLDEPFEWHFTFWQWVRLRWAFRSLIRNCRRERARRLGVKLQRRFEGYNSK